MGVNKVTVNTPEGERVIVDLTGTSVTPETLFAGETAFGTDGELKTGTFTIDEEISQQDALISQIQAALEGKSAGGGESLETCTVKVNVIGYINKLFYSEVTSAGLIESRVASSLSSTLEFTGLPNSFVALESGSASTLSLTKAEKLGFIASTFNAVLKITAAAGETAEIYVSSSGSGGSD